MTKAEILAALEGLKDYVNHLGKQQIDGIKAAVMALAEPEPVVMEELPEAEEPVDAEPTDEPAENPPPDLPEEPAESAGEPMPEKIKKPAGKRAKRGAYKR